MPHRPLLALLSLAVLASPSWATAQRPDLLILGGSTFAMSNTPLEGYFALHPEQRPEERTRSTACWRGYVATWELLDGRLYLRRMEVGHYEASEGSGRLRQVKKDLLCTVFPGEAPVTADWYSGTLILLLGPSSKGVNPGDEMAFERYILLTLEGGKLSRRLDLPREAYESFRDRQYRAFKGTEAYEQLYAEERKRHAGFWFTISDRIYRTRAEAYLSLPATP